jgi:hypothetical protein
MQEQFYAVAFRKGLYDNVEDLQRDLDQWVAFYNQQDLIAVGIALAKHLWKLSNILLP